jgi:hypothetical protein
MGGRIRIPGRWAAPLLATALAGSGCGSGLSRQELLQASQESIRVTSATSPVGASAPAAAQGAAAPDSAARCSGLDRHRSGSGHWRSPRLGFARCVLRWRRFGAVRDRREWNRCPERR